MDKVIKRELLTDLQVLEMGTLFANCHMDFVDTRNAVKQLNKDVTDIIQKYEPYLSNEK